MDLQKLLTAHGGGEEGDVAAGGGLVDAQAEAVDRGKHVVRHLRREKLVGLPRCQRGEEVKFQGYALGRRSELADHVDHVLVGFEFGQTRDVVFEIAAEEGQIDVLGLAVKVAPPLLFAEPTDGLARAEPYAVDVDGDGAVDAASARVGHPAPVLKRLADERVGGAR